MKPLLKIAASLAVLTGCASATPSAHTTVAFAMSIPAEELPPAASCAGLDREVQRTSIFAKKQDIVAVEALRGEHRVGARNVVERPVGARVVLAATPTSSAEWIQRVAQCHVDTYAAANVTAADEPLSVPGVRVHVKPVHAGYAVELTSESWDSAREIKSRSDALLTAR